MIQGTQDVGVQVRVGAFYVCWYAVVPEEGWLVGFRVAK